MSLQTIKDNTKILKELKGVYQAVQSVATGGVFSNIIRLIVLLCFGVGYWIFSKKLEEWNIKKAKELSVYEQEQLKAYLDEINKNSDDGKVTDLEQGF